MFKRLGHRIAVLIRWISIWINRIVRFITHDIWFLDEQDFSRWKARLVKDVRTVVLMLNTFNDQKIGYQITALAYRSMMAVVPAIAICFYLTDTVGLRDRFESILLSHIDGNEPIVNSLLSAADTIVNTAESGLFGFISMASFVWIVISLMMTVRRVFNNVWKVDKERNMLGMIGVILGITILSPFVIIMFFSGTVVYSNLLDILFPSHVFSDQLKNFVSWLSFALISIFVMSIMYKYIPGTKVRYRFALKAAIISGLAFTLVQYLYLETQMMVAKQSAVYGVLAAIPLFMIWLNLGWTIILYGAELSYAFQNVEQHRISIEKLNEMNEEAVRTRKERIQKGIKKI